MSPVIRDSRESDVPSVWEIYSHYVRHSWSTFEETPPSLGEISLRRAAMLSGGTPHLVAELDGKVVGYCYAGPYRLRPAYRFTVENSVYVAEHARGRGVGSALLSEVLERCSRGPWRQMIAIIGDSANVSSIALHRKFGFAPVGTLNSVGFKLGRWVDTVLMQRALGPGDSTPPTI
jgi:L-amino acid N-acyltransferase YncA